MTDHRASADYRDRHPIRCRDCGATFAGEPWQRLCWTCWRRERDRSTTEAAYQRGFYDGLRARAGADGPQVSALTEDRNLLDRVIRLCHPDRHPHERAAETNAVTAKLLGFRDALNARPAPRRDRRVP